jgi:hypothetical protein
MFVLHEDKLLEALADEEDDLFAFDPMRVDADELHSFIDVAEDQGVIGRADSEASTRSIRMLWAIRNRLSPSRRSGRLSSVVELFLRLA